MKKLLIFLAVALFSGCVPKTHETLPAEVTMNMPEYKYCSVYMKDSNFEAFTPFSGIALSSSSKIQTMHDFKSTSNETSVYACEISSDENVPQTFILQCMAIQKTPFITINTNFEELPDLIKLAETAKSLGEFNCPIMLNLFPLNESFHGNAEKYKVFWEYAAKIFSIYAPKTQIVFTISTDDIPFVDEYFPSDELISYIGISHFQQSGKTFALFSSLETMHNKYPNIPIIISQLGISHYDTEKHSYYTEETAKTIENVYNSAMSIPYLKGIIYSDKDLTASSPQIVLCNDYRVTSEKELFDSYIMFSEKYASNINDGYYKLNIDSIVFDKKAYVHEDILKLNVSIKKEPPIRFEHNNQYILAEDLNLNIVSSKENSIYIELN